jgi:hypothetical protein
MDDDDTVPSMLLLRTSSRFKVRKASFAILSVPLRETTVQSFNPRSISTRTYSMATPSKIQLTVKDTGRVHFKPPTEESAAKTSELLQENHEVCTPSLYLANPLRYPAAWNLTDT